ncbi:MAG TPA: PAS domain-containing protein [Stellaceae bacterium]|nr:PAS domain-containing protein [Stellaceae bacterium]
MMQPAALRDDPNLAALLRYWERKRGGRAMPRRRDIDPLDMPPGLLPHLELVEIAQGRLRYRLVGTAIVDAMGRDATGRFLDQVLAGPHGSFVERVHRTAISALRPVLGLCWLRRSVGGDLSLRRIVAPLSEDGNAVQMMLAATSLGAGRRGTVPPLAAADIEDDTIEVL